MKLMPLPSPARKRRSEKRSAPDIVAAVDLGSNSFHMIVARTVSGQLHVLDRLQEMVRLGAGLDEDSRLTKPAQRRALDCLERFGQRLRGMPVGSVRVVGTNTLRRARQADKFLARAQTALGHPIEVISGREEARLIYQGVASELADEGPRLVLDIGGGSTELILGEGREAKSMESLHMGCVSMSETHFPEGRITAKALRRAVTAARLELQPVAAQFRGGWQVAYGSSGTVRSIGAVVREAGWSGNRITPQALEKLRDALLSAGEVSTLKLGGLSAERAPVFPGGVAILMAVFQELDIPEMRIADNALREGLLQDLIGRIQHHDVREQTITALSARYHVDRAQAERVARSAQEFLEQVAEDWQLDEEDAAALSWAARLHEIGLAIAHNQYHKHGAYLARFSDLAGFSRTEQALLALLIRAHRRKFPVKEFAALPRGPAKRARCLAVLLRLAVLLHRSRTDAALPEMKLRAQKRGVRLSFPRGWLEEHPLTREDLEQENRYLRAARMRLKVAAA